MVIDLFYIIPPTKQICGFAPGVYARIVICHCHYITAMDKSMYYNSFTKNV